MVKARRLGSSESAIDLGEADDLAVLAGGRITNTGATTVDGDVGSYPSVGFSDTGTVSLTGAYHFGDSTAKAAKVNLIDAYEAAESVHPNTPVNIELGGRTMLPGNYSNPMGLRVHGTLTLDAQGDPNAIFIFQTPASLSTIASSHVNIINGGQACNVFWRVGDTTALGADSEFKGTIMTNSNFTGGSHATVLGRVLSIDGSVTLDANSITTPTRATPTALFVVPENISTTYGSASVEFTTKFETVNENSLTNVSDPSLGNAGWEAPTCAVTPAYTPTTPVGTSVITCTGGSGGALYVLESADTAILTVNKVDSKILVTTSTTSGILPGAVVSFSGLVSPKTGTGVCTGPVAFSLNRDPHTGIAGSYPLTNPARTTNWMVGQYQLLATYPGDSNCLPSSNSSIMLNVEKQADVQSDAVLSGSGSNLSPTLG